MGGVLNWLIGGGVTSQPQSYNYYYNEVLYSSIIIGIIKAIYLGVSFIITIMIDTARRFTSVRTTSTIRSESFVSPRCRYEESYGYGMRTNVPEYSPNESTKKLYKTVSVHNELEDEILQMICKAAISQHSSYSDNYNNVLIRPTTTPRQSESVRTISTIRNESSISPRYRYKESYGYRMKKNEPEHSPNKSTRKLYKTVIENSRWSRFYEEFTLVTLDELKYEYLKIEKLFLKSTKRNLVTINSIERVQNPFLMGRYVIAKKEMQLYSSPQEKLLFHGTQSSNISSICQNNFNWRLQGKKTGHRFGQGVSFSPNSYYASFYCDKGMDKVMLVAKVLVGKSCIGDKDMRIPPYVDFQREVRYDTSEKEDGQVVVKYRDDEYYPAYKISFQVKPEFYKKQ